MLLSPFSDALCDVASDLLDLLDGGAEDIAGAHTCQLRIVGEGAEGSLEYVPRSSVCSN